MALIHLRSCDTGRRDRPSLPERRKGAHIRFDAMWATDSALPAGTTHVSGCYDYPGM
jgi:hypothetical protein